MRVALLALALASGSAQAAPASARALKYDDFRPRCNFLTDAGVTERGGIALPARKAAVVDYVRSVCGKLEAAAHKSEAFAPSHELLFSELALIEHSFVDRGRIQAGMSFLDIVKMGFSNDLSPWLLRYKKTSEDHSDPAPSLYWHPAAAGEDPASRFDRLAEEKGVKEPGRYVVLESFDGQGSSPKLHVVSASTGQRWSLKWGDEVHSDVVSSRLFASLGFDVDHPRHAGPGEVVLVLGRNKNKISSVEDLVERIHRAYSINLSPFILSVGTVSDAEARANPGLEEYAGKPAICFQEAAMEPRPEKVTRLGGMGSERDDAARREVRGVLLAHQWVGNWDAKEDNTLLGLLNVAPGKQKLLAEYSDLGLTLGAKLTKLPRDLKGGIVNEFPWSFVRDLGDGRIQFNGRMNAILRPFREATFGDLKWMAAKIGALDEKTIRFALDRSGWPRTVGELYFRKLAYRRAELLRVFGLPDPHPVPGLDPEFSATFEPGLRVVKGRLEQDAGALALAHPEGLNHTKGRFRRYGW